MASLNPVELEKERMRAGDLQAERFGSREHHAMVWAHEVCWVESRRALASWEVPVWFSGWQLSVEKRAA